MTAGPTRNPLSLLFRAPRLRCPSCGEGQLFEAWLHIRDSCPQCGFRTDRGEQGYLVGAYMFNIMSAEILWAGVFLGIMFATWPNPPWDMLLWGGGALMIALPFSCYPFSKTVFLAFDLLFRAPEETESAR